MASQPATPYTWAELEEYADEDPLPNSFSWDYDETSNCVEYYDFDGDWYYYYYATSYDKNTNTAMIYYDDAEFYNIIFNETDEPWSGYEVLYFKTEIGERVVYAFEWEAEEAESIPTWAEILEQVDKDDVGWYIADGTTWEYVGGNNIVYEIYNGHYYEFYIVGYDSENDIVITDMAR